MAKKCPLLGNSGEKCFYSKSSHGSNMVAQARNVRSHWRSDPIFLRRHLATEMLLPGQYEQRSITQQKLQVKKKRK